MSGLILSLCLFNSGTKYRLSGQKRQQNQISEKSHGPGFKTYPVKVHLCCGCIISSVHNQFLLTVVNLNDSDESQYENFRRVHVIPRCGHKSYYSGGCCFHLSPLQKTMLA